MNRSRKNLALACATLVLAALSASAAAGMLDRIRDRHMIVFAYRDGAAPFSCKDRDGKVRGYTAELCTRVAAAIQRQLGLPSLDVQWFPVDADNRLERWPRAARTPNAARLRSRCRGWSASISACRSSSTALRLRSRRNRR